jgi:hypothetical protein
MERTVYVSFLPTTTVPSVFSLTNIVFGKILSETRVGLHISHI